MEILGEINWYSKFELAEHQLDRSLNLYLDEKDFISAITLAGVAEEIFRKILNKDGQKNALDEYIESFTAFDNDLKDYEKWFIKHLNYHRDNLKHFEVPHVKNSPYASDSLSTHISIYASAVTDVIFRALKNHSRLNKQTGFYTEKLNTNIRRFYASEQ